MSVTLGPINELTTAKYTSDPLVDDDGAVIPASSIFTAKLTFYDLKTGKIINSRNAQNVNNANSVAISSGGVVTWSMSSADNAIVNQNAAQEIHVAVFDFTWDAGASRCIHEVRFLVNNIGKLSA